jgi:hypothetical protein
MSFPEMQVGVKRPETSEQQIEIQADISAMRRAIARARRESSLINRSLQVAEIQGLSGEETYVLIAYNALIQLQEMWEYQIKLARLDIHQPFLGEKT